MDPFCVAIGFVVWMVIFVIIMLFGDNPFFDNTPIAYANWLFNDGATVFIW